MSVYVAGFMWVFPKFTLSTSFMIHFAIQKKKKLRLDY